jgi:hypothetical protein
MDQFTFRVYQSVISLFIYLSIYLSIYPTVLLLDLGRFFQFFNPTHTVGRTAWKRDQPVTRPLPTHRINAHRHPFLEWDSNPWYQRSSERRQFMPYTARPLWSAIYIPYDIQNPYWTVRSFSNLSQEVVRNIRHRVHQTPKLLFERFFRRRLVSSVTWRHVAW